MKPLSANARGDDPHDEAEARRLGRVVAFDHAADREPGIVARERERGVEMIAADIVEIDVDAVGRCGGEALEDRPSLVVDHVVGAERARRTRICSAPPAEPITVMPLALATWTTTEPDGTRGGRHEHDVALLRARRVEQAEIGGRAGHPEHAEELLGRLDAEVRQLVEPRAPATTASSRQPAMCWTRSPGAKPSALLSTTSPIAPPSIGSPTWNGWDVAFHVVHSAAHVGIDRQPLVADPDLAVAERRKIDLLAARNCRGSACRFGRLLRCQARAIVVLLSNSGA